MFYIIKIQHFKFIKWAERYESLSKRQIIFDYRSFKLMSPIDEIEFSSQNISQKMFYYLRSYKAATILCCRKNLKYLITVNDKSFFIICIIINIFP